jgi:DNA-binding XRE family transcriptional regulator
MTKASNSPKQVMSASIDGVRLFEDLDAVRRMRGLSWDAMAVIAGCSKATVYLLRRRRGCSSTTLLHICRAFQLPPCRYVNGCAHPVGDADLLVLLREVLVGMGVPSTHIPLIRHMAVALSSESEASYDSSGVPDGFEPVSVDVEQCMEVA